MQTPEKANIIISACNYWTRSNIGSGNALWADDVKFIYNTKLKSVTLGGEMLENFDEDVFEYYLPYADKDKDLNELRNEIRTIDKELVKLFEKRMTLCRAVGETKLKSQAPVFDAVREEENIRNLTALIENVTDKMYFTGWYRSLMDISKEIQRSICKKQG